MRLGVCGACENNRARYTCPRCKFTSCSSKCVQKHKLESGCDGIRNKTNYIPKDRIAELDVLSDYRLLESTSRRVDSYSRDEIKKSTRKFRDPHAMPLPPHLIKFRNACFRRGRCRLHFLPQKFQRHQENTSRFVWKKNEICWRIQLLLPHAYSSSGQKVIMENVSENTILYDLFQPYVIGTCDTAKNRPAERSNDGKDCEQYDIYKTAGFSGVKVLLKSEGDFHTSKRYHEVDISKCLKDNLFGKNIVEHPVLMIILNHHSDSFNISDGSDEDDLDDDTRNDNTGSGIQGMQEDASNHAPTSTERPNCNKVVDQEKTKESISDGSIMASHPTRREAEFNKNCYDFYLNYYSEKYAITNPQLMSKGDMVHRKQQPMKPNTTQYYTASNSNPAVSSSVGRNEAANRSSSQSLVARRLLNKSTNDQTTSKNYRQPNVNDDKSSKGAEAVAKNKTINSLSLLAVYSDSEEEMES